MHVMCIWGGGGGMGDGLKPLLHQIVIPNFKLIKKKLLEEH